MKLLSVTILTAVALFAADGDAVRYVCPGGESITVRYQDEKKSDRGIRAPRALVEAAGKPRIALPRVISGSGARYSDGYTTLWNKGDEVMLESGSLNVKGCKTSDNAASPALSLTGRWTLAEVDGQPVNLPRPAYMEFQPAANRVAGSGGCNRFSAGYTLDGALLKFSAAIATRMACAGPGMQVEMQLFKALEVTASAAKSGDTLTLLDASGKTLATFKQD